MTRRIYRLLLHLLPRERRDRYGEEMVAVFRDLEAAARDAGVVRVAALWTVEIMALLRISIREWLARWSARLTPAWIASAHREGRGAMPPELLWAWRGLRVRRRRAVLIVALLAVTLAANALVFATADALVFHPVPYRDPDRLVEIQSTRRAGGRLNSFLQPAELDLWHQQSDLFAGVESYLTKSIFIVAHGVADLVPTADVTPGLIDLLGARTRWGRSFTAADAGDASLQAVLVSESLARGLFDDPADAPGKRIETTGQPLLVAGVMPADFHFPNASVQIWRALDPRGPLTRNFSGTDSIARVAPGVSLDQLKARMAERSAAIGAALGAGSAYRAEPAALPMATVRKNQRTMFLALVGAALCLLLTASASIVNLELTNVVQRARTFAIRLALGASRASLVRVVLLEGALLVASAAILATGLTLLGVGALASHLAEQAPSLSTNSPIHLGGRVLLYMSAAAAIAWIAASVPVVFHVSRANLVGLIKVEDRSSAVSRRSSAVRRALTFVEIALAVLLAVGGGLYVRSYRTLLILDKGFDSTNLAEVSYTIPPQFFDNGSATAFGDDVVARLAAVPGVAAAIFGSAPPSMGGSPFGGVHLQIDGGAASSEPALVGITMAAPAYFSVVRLPLLSGRLFRPDEPPTSAVVTESFARHFWPGENAVGHTFRFPTTTAGPTKDWIDVVGVVGDIREDPRLALFGRTPAFYFYSPRQPPPPAPPNPSMKATIDAGGMYRFVDVTLRLTSAEAAPAVLAAARAIDPRLRVTLDMVDDTYAGQYRDLLLATSVVGAFSAMALAVSLIGVYGVMAFLVAGRTREIGIRMALGADRQDVRRLVMRSALTMVVAGACAGALAAAAASHWAASQFYGVSPTDPITYVAVTLATIGTAALATWQPARQAARVDPAVTLRAE